MKAKSALLRDQAAPGLLERGRLLLGTNFFGSLAVAGSHGLRMVVSLVTIKLIAVLLGATGLGLLGNAMSVTSIASVFAGGGISTGVAKYVAEYRNRPIRMARFIKAAFVYGLIFSGVLLLISVAAAAPLAEFLFGTSRYWWLTPVGAAMQFLAFLGLMAISVSNGLGRTDLFVAITVPALVGAIPVTYALIVFFGLPGAACALFLNASCTGITGAILIARSPLVRIARRLRIDRADFRRLAGYGLMLAASAISIPVGEILIRSRITDAMGYEQAGLWQALIRLSAAYLGFFNVVLITRYMPALSALTDSQALFRKVTRTLWTVAGLFLLFGAAIFLARDLLITTLFSRDFLPLSDFIAFQIVGDGFRLCAYVVGFLAVAKGATRLYIAGEAVQMALWVSSSFAAIHLGGDLRSVSIGYMIAYALYFCVVSGVALWRRSVVK